MTGARSGKSPKLRNAELAKIHLLAKQLNMDRDTYEALLYAQARVESAAKLDEHQRRQVIEHLQALITRQGGKATQRPHNFHAEHRAELSKIEALLADDGKPWAYAEGMARRMFRKERMEFCGPRELMGLIAALEKQALKRLQTALEAELGERWELTSSLIADQLFDFKCLRQEISRNSQTMSLVLRWLRGALSPSCSWPIVQTTDHSKLCRGCAARGPQRVI